MVGLSFNSFCCAGSQWGNDYRHTPHSCIGEGSHSWLPCSCKAIIYLEVTSFGLSTAAWCVGHIVPLDPHDCQKCWPVAFPICHAWMAFSTSAMTWGSLGNTTVARFLVGLFFTTAQSRPPASVQHRVVTFSLFLSLDPLATTRFQWVKCSSPQCWPSRGNTMFWIFPNLGIAWESPPDDSELPFWERAGHVPHPEIHCFAESRALSVLSSRLLWSSGIIIPKLQIGKLRLSCLQFSQLGSRGASGNTGSSDSKSTAFLCATVPFLSNPDRKIRT